MVNNTLLFPLEDKFIRVAKIITDNTNITFGFKGSSYTCSPTPNDGFHISFAVMPHNPSEELIKALEGFLDHELAHALFSDFKVITNIPEIMDTQDIFIDPETVTVIKNITNILEDSFIERKMGERYIGSRDNLAYMNNFVNTNIIQDLSEEISGWECVLITLAIITSKTNMPDCFKAVEKYLRKVCAEELEKVSKINSTMDSCLLACDIYKKILLEHEKNKNSSEQEKNEEQENKSGNADNDAFTETPFDFNPNYVPLNNPKLDYKKEVFERLTKESNQCDYNAYLPRPYTRQYDQIEYNRKAIRMNITRSNSSNFYANKLANLIKTETLTAWNTGLNRGKLNTRDLYRLTTDSLVFKNKRKTKLDLDIVFCIGVDVSQSMQPESTLKILADIIEILGNIDIPFEVFTYTTTAYPDTYAIRIEDINNLSFTRTMALKLNVLKKYKETYQSIKNYIIVNEQGWTPTPEAYEYAIRSLSQRSEAHKIFINITDGYPQEATAERTSIYYLHILKNLMRLCTLNKIEYVNIGYRIDAKFKNIDPSALLTTETNFLDKFLELISLKIRKTKFV